MTQVYLALYKGRKQGTSPKELAQRLMDWAVRWVTRGQYSHCEIATAACAAKPCRCRLTSGICWKSAMWMRMTKCGRYSNKHAVQNTITAVHWAWCCLYLCGSQRSGGFAQNGARQHLEWWSLKSLARTALLSIFQTAFWERKECTKH